MSMTPPIRRLTLTAHVITSVGWVGALAVFFAHALAGLFSQNEQIVAAVSISMAITAWFVILPLGLASFATGLVRTVYGLGSTAALLDRFQSSC